jgi:hypothetical protein
MHNERYTIFGLPLSLVAVLCCVTVASGAVFYFFTSSTFQKDIIVLGADVEVYQPTHIEYMSDTVATDFYLLNDNTEGGGSLAIDDCFVLCISDTNMDVENPSDMVLYIEVIKSDPNLMVNVSLYWVAYWLDGVSTPSTNIFEEQLNAPLNTTIVLSNAEWADKMMETDSPKNDAGTAPVEAESMGLLLDFDFDRDGTPWGNHYVQVICHLGVDE